MSRDIMCIKRNNNNAMIHKSLNLTYIIDPSLQFKAKIQVKHHDCYLHYTAAVVTVGNSHFSILDRSLKEKTDKYTFFHIFLAGWTNSVHYN